MSDNLISITDGLFVTDHYNAFMISWFYDLTFYERYEFLHGTPLEKSHLDFHGLSLETASFFYNVCLVIPMLVSWIKFIHSFIEAADSVSINWDMQ